ncbi:MAG: alanine dehydrogenase [Spirochaetales bacterium]
MILGTVKEIKTHEYRVGLTPANVKVYTARGHKVLVERGAGLGTGYSDEEYQASGAHLLATATEIWGEAEMMVKVKEPVGLELDLLRKDQILFTYLHLAADHDLTEVLLERGVRAVAYETIEAADHSLPCLTPMSEIAGRLAVQEGAKYLEKAFGGRGILLGGVPGVPRGHVVIVGGGVVGLNACKIASGIGAKVTVLDVDARRLAFFDDMFGSRVDTLYSNEHNLDDVLRTADVVIGAILVHGETAPKLLHREHLRTMRPGSVLVDVAIDQGGMAETSRPTTQNDPIYVEEGVVHYCVTNMPGSVPFTSTVALTSATLKYGLRIADEGLEASVRRYPDLAKGLNVYKGTTVHQGVAKSLGLHYKAFM